MKRELAVSQWSVYALAVAPAGKMLAADGAGKVSLWNMETGEKIGEIGQSNGNIGAIQFSPDGKILAFDSDKGAELWDLATKRRLHLIENAKIAAFAPDSATFAVNGFGALKFYNTQSGAFEREIAVPNPLKRIFPKPGEPDFSPLQGNGLFYSPSAVVAPDFQSAASIYADGSIGIWNTKKGELQKQLRGFQRDVAGGDTYSLAFAPDGQTLAASSRSGEAAIWSLQGK